MFTEFPVVMFHLNTISGDGHETDQKLTEGSVDVASVTCCESTAGSTSVFHLLFSEADILHLGTSDVGERNSVWPSHDSFTFLHLLVNAFWVHSVCDLPLCSGPSSPSSSSSLSSSSSVSSFPSVLMEVEHSCWRLLHPFLFYNSIHTHTQKLP